MNEVVVNSTMKLTERDLQAMAALLSYVRNAWGNAAGEVTPKQVAGQR
jgi:hypothetical protein